MRCLQQRSPVSGAEKSVNVEIKEASLTSQLFSIMNLFLQNKANQAFYLQVFQQMHCYISVPKDQIYG
jgi:hypothetical protein